MVDIKEGISPEELPPSYEMTTQNSIPRSPPVPAPAPVQPPLRRSALPLNLPIVTNLRNRRVILASASPRRKQLLAQIGLSNLEIIPSTVPEAFPKSLAPFEYVLKTATQKAMTVYTAEINNTTRGEPALVIAADTVVVTNTGQVLEKPRSEADHIAMLTNLRDQVHHNVFTAVVAMAPLSSARDPGYALESTVEVTTVRFGQDISDDLITAYVKTREGADKAGGYGMQGIGAILVDRIEGSFDNAIGLPLRATLKLVEKVLNQDDENDELEDEFADLDDDDNDEKGS